MTKRVTWLEGGSFQAAKARHMAFGDILSEHDRRSNEEWRRIAERLFLDQGIFLAKLASEGQELKP